MRAVVAIALAACGSDPTLHPGPCKGVRTNRDELLTTTCTMTYDEGGRPASTECSTPLLVETWIQRSYASGVLTRVEAGTRDSGNNDESTWTLGEAVAETSSGFAYDSLTSFDRTSSYETTLRFGGHPLDPENRPAAPDALLSAMTTTTNGDADPPQTYETNVVYSYDGPPHVGVRARVGSDGSRQEYGYDELGRLIEVDGAPAYAWEDERLVADLVRDIRYEYDSAGNLTRKTGPDIYGNAGFTMTFDYGCW